MLNLVLFALSVAAYFIKIKQEKNNNKQNYTINIVNLSLWGLLSVVSLIAFSILVCIKQPQPKETPKVKCLTTIPTVNPDRFSSTPYNILCSVRHSKSNQTFVVENELQLTKNDLEAPSLDYKSSTSSIKVDSVDDGLPLSHFPSRQG